jgi:phosphatidylglycerol lysyltransferase
VTDASSIAAAPSLGARSSVLAQAATVIGVMALLIHLAWERIAGIDPAALWTAAAATPIWALVAAAALTALSHAAVTFYDPPALRAVGATVPTRRALGGGFAASALGQMLGFGPIVGAAARWRLHQAAGVTAAQAVAATAVATAGFMLGALGLLGLLAAAAPLPIASLTGMDATMTRTAGALAAAAVCGLGLAVWLRPPRRWTVACGVTVAPLGGRWVPSMAALSAVELTAAAGALWVLLPENAVTPFPALMAAYVAALLLGQISGAPGGLGVFEAALLLALPHAPAEGLLAAAALYRLVYVAPAGVVAAAMALRAPRPATLASHPCPAAARVIAASPRAEAALARLGDKRFFTGPDGRAAAMLGVRAGDWVLMGDPFGPRDARDRLMRALEAEARAAHARLSVYKAEDAIYWSARGWRVLPLGEEAWLDPREFRIDTPTRRELRRKLAQARKAGATIHRHAPGAAPLTRLAAVAAAWRAAKGGREMTFSMGRFDPGFVADHAVIEARVGDATVAFLTVWRAPTGAEHAIDLMRALPDAPQGVMHLLTAEAIAAAAESGAARFSLCMAPLSGLDRLRPAAGLSRALRALHDAKGDPYGLQGLRRFKESFRPTWTPRYVAAPGPLGPLRCLLAARGLVHAPTPEPDIDALRAAEAFLAGDADFGAEAPAAAARAV